MNRADIVIVGAGPAGLAAAEQLIAHELEIVIIDEQVRPGGQIYRQPPHGFKVSNWLSSRIYKKGKELLARVSRLDGIHWLTQTTVLGITKNDPEDVDYPHKISVCNLSGTRDIQAKSVLIASGCHDMSVVFPGWNLPGVMAAGGIQAFVKSQQLIPGEKFLFAGTHPLQLIVADQITQAGGNVAGILFAQPLSRALAILKSPSVFIRHLPKFIYIAATLFRLVKAGVPVYFSKTIIQANGDEKLHSVTSVDIDKNGNINRNSTTEFDCDRLGVCFSFLASSELARQCDVNYSWSDQAGGWIIEHDEWMSTSIRGLFVAGEITGVAGAEVAAEEGRLAALGIALNLDKLKTETALRLSGPLRRRLSSLNKFADILKQLAYPDSALLRQLMTENSTLCKCEEISVGEFKQQLEENPHVTSASAAKLLSRTGMGLCQGRYCHYHITKLLTQHSSLSEQDIGPFNARFPAKPVTIKSLVS